ncbi:MAG TPA: sodium-dependent transporter, partial [Rhodothermia bacterium]
MSTTSTPDRGQWSGKLGFILAAAGSAIGLGNIWRFPYSAGEGGGGVFVLIYLTLVLLVGVPVILTELSIGRKTKRNPVGAFKALAPGSWWPVLGGLGVFTGFAILAFYSVVAGWTVGYLYEAAIGAFATSMTADESATLFGSLVGNGPVAIFLTGVFMVMTLLVVRGGVSEGIERATKILMPLLFAILIVLAVRALTLPGGMQGVEYLFKPDFSEVTVGVVMSALGQALFSLSLGMGAMITYGSYFPKGESLPVAAASVALFDTLVAVLAGLIVFPALFSAGVDPAAGPGLVFVVLPTIFNAMPAGTLFAIAFYVLLAIAALTSTISLLEVVVSYFIDERKWTRNRAAWVVGGACFLFAIPSALSQGATDFWSSVPGVGLDWLTLQSNLWGNYSLTLGAMLTCIFVGWKWGIPSALEALEEGNHPVPGRAMWGILVRYVCPVAMMLILIYVVVTG